MDKKEAKYIKDHIVSVCDLSEFIESETGVDLKWNRDGSGAVCACPFPDHYEKKPSFHINNLEGKWVFHCFGCQRKGTIIQFVYEYFEKKNFYETIKYLCDYYELNDIEDLAIKGLKNVSKKVNFNLQMENENVIASNQCRMLLRKDFRKHKDWVCSAYKRLNRALSEKDQEEIQNISNEAFSRMRL